MESIEKIIEDKVKNYIFAREKFAELLKRIVEKGKEIGITERTQGNHISAAVKISKDCKNPYRVLLGITEAYEQSEDQNRCRRVINDIEIVYYEKKAKGERLEEFEIGTLIGTIHFN